MQLIVRSIRQPANMTQFNLTEAKNNGAVINGNDGTLLDQTKHPARVEETNKIAAINVDLYTLDDAPYKYYYVDNATGEFSVYFWYRQKGQHEVTVQYWDNRNNQQILSYSVTATTGEKLKLVAPEYLENGKYKRADTQVETVEVPVDGAKTVKLQYVPNYVTVTVQTNVDGATTSYDSSQVNQTDAAGNPTGKLTLIVPNKTGYTLQGIQADNLGGENTYPTSYDAATSTLKLSGLTQDTNVTYYYKKTSATEYQSDLTIKYQYNGYDLKDEKTIKVNCDEVTQIEIPKFTGYQAKGYKFEGDTGFTDITDAGITFTPDRNNKTLIINYVRPDNTIVLPGVDKNIPAPDDKDNVIVKPGDETPTIDGDGNVKIDPDDNNSTVIRPIDPANPDQGKEEIKVPGGTVIKPDGTD